MTLKPIPETISFLFAKASRAHHAYASVLLREVGLYPGQEKLLQCLWQEDHLTHTELAACLNIRLPTLNTMVHRLEQAGFLIKYADTEDARVSRVKLTAKGRELQSPTEQVWDRLENHLLTNFTMEEQQMLQNLLQKVIENMRLEE